MGYIKAKWCFLRDNDRIRTIVKYKINNLGKSQLQISKETGISMRNLSGYLNGSRPFPTQLDVIHLLDYLGLEPELTLKVKE